jgi:hypothetical protein
VHTSQRLSRGENAIQDLFASLSFSDSEAETELLLPSDSAIRNYSEAAAASDSTDNDLTRIDAVKIGGLQFSLNIDSITVYSSDATNAGDSRIRQKNAA